MAALRKKPVQLLLVLLLALFIMLAGAFAWSSFNQSRINVFKDLIVPNVNLHDDFAGGPNKDVYVENSGDAPIFLRVRLTEYLQTADRGSLVEGYVRDDAEARLWPPRNGVDPADGTTDLAKCTLPLSAATADAWAGENFHDYYIWTMGGQSPDNPTAQIYYKPATEDQRGGVSEDGTEREPQVVSDPLTGTSPAGDASALYAEQVAAKMDELLLAGTATQENAEELALTELGLKKTQTADVLTMAEWVKGAGAAGQPGYRAPYAPGDYWVIDQEDGWCYWAKALNKGQATGLLLDRVDRTEKRFGSDAQYAINAWLQAVTEEDLGRFETPDAGGITENAKTLLRLAAGKLTIAADGGTYQVNGDGTYTQLTNADGTPATDAKAFIPLAVDSATGAGLGVNAPAASRMAVGARVTLEALAWNGTDYTNFTTFAAAPKDGWYNLSASADGGYEVTGIKLREDGVAYLALAPVIDGAVDLGSPLYLVSLTRDADASAYRPANPGAGPYGAVYPGADGIVGTADDITTPSFTEAFLAGKTSEDLAVGGTFTADGYGWVVLGVDPYGNRLVMTTSTVASMGARATGITAPAYADSLWPAKAATFAAGLTDLQPSVRAARLPDETAYAAPLAWDGIPAGDGLSTCVNATSGTLAFPLSAGEYVHYILGNEVLSGYRTAADASGAAALSGLRSRQTGGTEGEALTIGTDGTLSGAQANDDCPPRMALWLRLSDADKLITASDAELQDWKAHVFSEPFLASKTSLNVNDTFTVDGTEWIVVAKDGYGNRMLATVNSPGPTPSNANGSGIYGTTNTYAGSTLEQYYKDYYETEMPTLKPYVLSAKLPQVVHTQSIQSGLSSPEKGTRNVTAFAMSAQEYTQYFGRSLYGTTTDAYTPDLNAVVRDITDGRSKPNVLMRNTWTSTRGTRGCTYTRTPGTYNAKGVLILQLGTLDTIASSADRYLTKNFGHDATIGRCWYVGMGFSVSNFGTYWARPAVWVRFSDAAPW